ncbi:MAG: hypothetical protein P1S46_06165 [bacterium]|nr:hypothetical protein [bacterium]
MTTIPTTEPSQVRAGDTVKWTRALSDYPPATWTLSYALRGLPGEIDITASDNGDGTHLVSVAPATTAVWEPGVYNWSAKVTDGSDVYTVDLGSIIVLEDLSSVSGAYDGRTHARKTLDALEAVIQGRASRSDLNYTIAGRSLQHMSHKEIRDEWSFWRQQVVMEEKAERIANGEGHSGRIKARFV